MIAILFELAAQSVGNAACGARWWIAIGIVVRVSSRFYADDGILHAESKPALHTMVNVVS